MNRFFSSIRFGFIGLFATALMLFAPTAFSSDVLRVEGAPVISTKAEEAVFWRSAPANIRSMTAIAFTPLPALALKTLQEENSPDSSDGFRAKALKIGVNRNADTELDGTELPFLNWQNIGDGYIARWAVRSPEAKAMRVALQLRALPDSAELRFSGSGEPERIIGVISGKEANALRDDNKIYWTPVTEGETQNIEIYLPSTINIEDIKIRLNAISHLFVSAQNGFDTSLVVKASQYCEVNVACKFSSLGTAFQNTSKAVAMMTFQTPRGPSQCSGTLLNPAGPQVPYFWSAAHCISTQAMANTLNTHWFYETTGCTSSTPSSNYRQLSGGAQLLHANTSKDTLLLRLNDSLPAGAFLAGWAATRFSSGSMIGIHHPDGDYKKVSIGKGEDRTCSGLSLPSGYDSSSLSMVSWSEGSTEGGSSGSGLFTLSDGEYYLRGGLMGGTASCANTNRPVNNGNVDCYSSLNPVWDDIKQYLSGSTPPPPPPPIYGPSLNYSGQWIRDINEMGWGLSVIMGFSDQRYIFVPWYTYDSNGRAQWYLFQGNVWSANDVFTGEVIRYTGSPWHTMPWNNNRFSGTPVGTAKLTFTSATRAQFEYDVEGSRRTIALTKIE